jgi:RND family efflux transporter MFP subunit
VIRAILTVAAVLALAGCGNAPTATPTPSALVSAVPAQRGSLPATVVAYGSVAPAAGGTQTFNMAQAGQVIALRAVPGMAIHTGQFLATFATAPSARSSYQQAVNAVSAARKQQATTAQLLSQQLATRDQMTQANKAVADAQAALAGLQADGAGQAVRSIVAPFEGVVTTVSVAQGDRTQPGAAILTVARAGGIVVTAGLDPADRPGVVPGQAASLQRLSGGAALAGRVLRVGGALNAQTRLVDVDVGFPTGRLLPGESLRVAIETGRVAGWVVPHRAVVTSGGPARVFQIAGGKAKSVPVQVMLSSETGDVVEGNLDAAQPVITDGAYQVSDGDAVRRNER